MPAMKSKEVSMMRHLSWWLETKTSEEFYARAKEEHQRMRESPESKWVRSAILDDTMARGPMRRNF